MTAMPQLQLRAVLLSSVVVGVALSWIARAESVVPTIDEATFVAEVATKHPRGGIVLSRVEAARAEIAAASVRPNPSISIDREEPFVDGNGVPTNYLRLSIPIDLSGRRSRQIDAAETGIRAATSDAAQSTHELVVEALRVFDACARARLHVEILTAARGDLVRAVEIARKRGKAGDASGYEVQRFELELAAHDDDLASATLELHRMRVQIAALVGRPGELDAASALVLPPSVPTLKELLAKANDRGDLRGARLRGEAARQRSSAAGRGWVPLPTLVAGAMTSDLGDQTGTGYVAGLALTIPIFDRGQGDRERANADRHAAEAEARALEREVPTTVQLARETLVARIEQARRLASTQVDRLDVIVRAAEAAFREGNASVVELLDAHRMARAVRLRSLELLYQVSRDRRDLELAVGQRL
jgi:cobalt-zinc-cadmium efflux system outer membrane protein